MSYWHQMYHRPQKAERLEVKNGEARFESLMAKSLSEKDHSFAESLKRQFEAAGKLSSKQIECFEKMEQRYSPESVLRREQWVQSYKTDHRETALIVANYYITTNYFRDLALKIGTDEDFVPTQRQFEALWHNKYAQKAILAATAKPNFLAGTLCKVRQNQATNRLHHNELALVVANHPSGLYASSTVLVNGETVTYEDRRLKPHTHKRQPKQ